MALSVPRHAVLTGAPGAGKTSLLDAAASVGWQTSPEVAREILCSPGGMELRERDPLAFADAMLEAHQREYERHANHPYTVLFDRGLPDVVGFLEVSGLPVSPQVDRAYRTWRYAGPVFRAPAWAEIYTQDPQRIQDWHGAVASDKAVTAAWQRYGYEPINLPLAGVDERLSFLRRTLAQP